MNLSEKLREMIEYWRSKEYEHLYKRDELQRQLGCSECADDLEEFLNCNPSIDSIAIP